MAATLDRAVFFARVRAAPFGGSLTPAQVAGITTILDACPAGFAPAWLAYCLATAFHETARTMQPIEEYGRGKGRAYGPTGFWGRGYVQLTWQANYARATTELRRLGVLSAAQDLVTAPALAMRPDLAAAIMFRGMAEGWFTGKRLADYFGPGKSDPIGARHIINGTDRAATIAGYHASFAAALEAAGYGEAGRDFTKPPVSTIPPAGIALTANPAVPQPAPTGGLSSAAAPAARPQPGFWSRVHALLSRKDKVA